MDICTQKTVEAEKRCRSAFAHSLQQNSGEKLKKYNKSKKHWHMAVAIDRNKRRLKWKFWRKIQNKLRNSAHTVTLALRDGRSVTALARQSVPVPTVLCFDRNFEGTLAFLRNVRNSVLKKAVEFCNKKNKNKHDHFISYYDFSNLNFISPAAALVIAAIYDRAMYISKQPISTINEDMWKPHIRAHLSSLGFYDILNIRPPEDFPKDDLKILKFKTGRLADGEPAEKLQETMAELLPQEASDLLFYAEPYSGMLEAILNSNNWAYPEGQEWDYPQKPNWWLTGAVDINAKRVTVVAFDQGVTIPASLPTSIFYEKADMIISRAVRRWGGDGKADYLGIDGITLHAAMKLARSKTGLPQHGKGLHTMIEVAERSRHGRLRIISRRGVYVWETERRAEKFVTNTQLDGTLIEWTLEL